MLTYFSCTINILDRKDAAESEEHNFGESRHELGRRDEDVHAVLALRNHAQTGRHQRRPVLRDELDLVPHLDPLLALRTEQAAHAKLMERGRRVFDVRR
jgi:hypothetical protein